MRRTNHRRFILVAIGLAAILTSLFGSSLASAAPANNQHSINSDSGGRLVATARREHAGKVSGHSANFNALPKEKSSAAAGSHHKLAILTGVSASVYAQRKAAAAHNKNAPRVSAGTNGTPNISVKVGFQGMADSPTICPYFGGCQPPDMALATSPNYVFQGVNSSFALYDIHRKLLHGPVNSQVFFGVANPPNNCDPAGPFMSDPRAFYDPNDKLFWIAMLQLENGAGIAPGCPEQSLYWIANLNPKTGAMHIYSFDMTLGTTNVADYTEFGFSNQAIAFSGDMFDQPGINYLYAEAFFVDKHSMEQGAAVTPVIFSNFAATGPNGTILLDTVQPVETETTVANDPGTQFLVNTFNMNGDPFGDTFCFLTCHGYVVWQYNPVSQSIRGVIVSSFLPPVENYALPPNADQPICTFCVDTNDTRISATPVYSVGGGSGLISFSVNTAISNGLQTVPGIFWAQVQVLSVPAFLVASTYQSGYLAFTADQSAFFGAFMQDKNGRLVMLFDTSSINLNPSIMVTERLVSDPINLLERPTFVIKGPSPTLDSRWGDYEAASYDGFSTNHIWVASQYSVSGDWNTFIARV